MAGDQSEPLIRAGLRGFLDLDRFDVAAIVVLVVLAFGVRYASPVYPNFLTASGGISAAGVGYPYNGSACGSVPLGRGGREVTRCGYVFDEVYFPVDAAKDLRSPAESYFDPEPPLAKLLMAPPIAWWGFSTWTWRASTVLFGSLLVGVVYLIARRLRRDRFFAVGSALFVCLDGLAFVESRTGVIDIIAIFFVAFFYYAFLLHWQARTRTQWRTTLYFMAGVGGLAFGAKLTAIAPLIVAAGLVVARALLPRLAAGFTVVARLAHEGPAARLWRQAAGRRAPVHYALAALIAAAIFCACFSRYLTIDHPDVYFFTRCDQGVTGLTGTPVTLHVPALHAGPLSLPNPVEAIHNIYENMAAGLQYHATECHSHPYSSVWYTWPIMEHPVLFYYTTGQGGQPVWSITDMGNPALWWLAIPALLFCLWRATTGPNALRAGVACLGIVSLVVMILMFQAAQRYHDPSNFHTSFTAEQFLARFHRSATPSEAIEPIHAGPVFLVAFAGMIAFAAAVTLSAVLSRRFVPAFIVVGYVAAWMMWVPGNQQRVLFFYHALGMLLFAALALAYALTALRRVRIPLRARSITAAPLAYTGTALVVAAFAFFYPVWTAATLSPADHAMRIWVDTP